MYQLELAGSFYFEKATAQTTFTMCVPQPWMTGISGIAPISTISYTSDLTTERASVYLASKGHLVDPLQPFSPAWEQSSLFHSFFQCLRVPVPFSILRGYYRCGHLCIYVLLTLSSLHRSDKKGQNEIKESYIRLPSSACLLCRLRQ